MVLFLCQAFIICPSSTTGIIERFKINNKNTKITSKDTRVIVTFNVGCPYC